MKALPPGDTLIRATAWTLAMIASFLLQMIAVRELSANLGVFQIMFMRSCVSLAIVTPLIALHGRRLLHTSRIGTHFARNGVNFAAQSAWAYGVAMLPLAAVTALEFSTPLWVALLAALFLGERLSRHRLIAVVSGLVGVLIILRPGVEAVQLAALVVLGSALCFATSNVIAKALTRTEDTLTIVIWMQIMQFPIGFLACIWSWTDPLWSDAPWLLVIGCTGLTAHYSMAKAFSLADATVVMPIDFLRLPLAAMLAWAVYREPLNVFVFLGAALMFAGNFHSVWQERRARRD
ncbi:MAG: DMT family transporter [Defluviicoccus sp.]|nr:DMT family transporter [Defluviicoccus sp.]MDE0385852.1 DMT family transporter [Defluviicoccus sp.]